MLNKQEKSEKKLSPEQIPDHKDPGDETQRNFRYQNGYGAILLIASARGDKPYRAIWCEHHDDYLCEREDNLFDAYQIKTRKPEQGYWKLSDPELKGSVKKFCNLLSKFGDSIQDFCFVSNTETYNVSQNIQNQNDLRRSPVQFLRVIKDVESESDIPDPFNKTFHDLLTFCEQPPDILFSVLKNLFVIKGPGRDSFDAEIVQIHLPSLKTCSNLPIPVLNKISNALIQKIYSASALHVEDPNQHIFSLNMISSENPIIKAKRVALELLDEIISENISSSKFPPDVEEVRLTDELSKERKTIFIYSHPSDANFARWLSLQLTNNGYKVWCDIIDFDKGDEAKRKKDIILTEETFKFIFVLTNVSNRDSQSLENLKFAYDLSSRTNNREFIISADLEELGLDKNILLSSTLEIKFSGGWAKGLHNLLEKLDRDPAPIDLSSSPSKSNLIWRSQFNPDRGVTNEPEEYLSNWFRIELPEKIYFHEIQRTGIGSLSVPADLPYPGFQHSIYLVTFTNADDFSGRIGVSNSIKNSSVILTQDFLRENYDHSLVSPKHAWNFVINLLNQAWDLYFETSKLGKYELANNRKCYYFHKDYGAGRINFIGADGQKTWRSLVGKKNVNYWHFAFQGRPNLHPYPYYLIKSHVLSSSDGYNIWKSDKRLHKARRSWFKDWWNAIWRDRLLAAISFVAGFNSTLNIPVGNDVFLKVSTFPERFISPVSYALPDDENIYEKEFPDDELVIEEDFEDLDE